MFMEAANTVNTIPSDVAEVLEFEKVLELITRECAGPLGVHLIDHTRPICDAEFLSEQLNLSGELLRVYHLHKGFRVFPYEDISSLEKYLHIEGYVYELDLVVHIKHLLHQAIELRYFLGRTDAEDFPELHTFLRSIETLPELFDHLHRVIDDEGQIRRTASPELDSLHRLLNSKMREAHQKFSQVVRHFQKQGWLTDNKESARSGRRVLSVPAEHKRRIKGIIHDESASGKTCFIEPEELISVNNDLFEIERSIKREEYKILKEISALIKGNGPCILDNYSAVGKLDAHFAKVKFGMKIKGMVPPLRESPGIELSGAKHPLLMLKYEREEREVVAFDLHLDHENRILLVSGPNAGGKSVLLKSVGLLQLMFQSAIPVSVGRGTKMGLFSGIFADVGDQQSLEDDLSTFSSHLTNMKQFLEHANPHSLVLIDEFGSGTDPRIGGALAEGILRRFRYLKTFGVMTTHYGNLKIYGNNATGIVNGAMVFDRKNMKPTYHFVPGKPGSSFGFEIAEKVGIHPAILKYAKDKAGKKIEAVDGMLADLQKEKKVLEDKIRQMEDREKELKQMIKNFEHLHRELEVRRKKMKLNKKEYELAIQSKMNREFEKELKKLKKEQNLQRAEQSVRSFKESVQTLSEEKDQLREKIAEAELGKGFKWEIGSYAKLRSGSDIGRLTDLKKKKAVLEFESGLRMEVNTADLIPVNTPIERKTNKSVSTDLQSTGSGFNSRLDIRGLRYREAVELLVEYFEKALLANQSRLEITHGKGEGALLKALKESLKEFPDNFSMSHPPEDEGGMGKSIVLIR
jgi:DNA mismatch repair protein MutS2